jgi:hypothetical protein
VKTVALVTIHGMGKTESSYAAGLNLALRKMLGARATRVSFHSVFYDGPLQSREDNVFGDMMSHHALRWSLLREVALFGLADAVALESRRSGRESDYAVAQRAIAQCLKEVLTDVGEVPLVFVAHSLGCQVLSNYLWDAQAHKKGASGPSFGLWADDASLLREMGIDEAHLDFYRLATLKTLVTTGCNIPVFVAAVARQSIVAVGRPNDDFEWHNYFDADDPLGWPLQPLSPSFDTLVEDHEVAVGNLATGWNPLSHNAYWSSDVVLRPICNALLRHCA